MSTPAKCHRCGGSGQFPYVSMGQMIHGVCFRCGGSGTDPHDRYHTPEEREKLDRRNEKAAARREAKRLTELEGNQQQAKELYPEAVAVLEQVYQENEAALGRNDLPSFLTSVAYRYFETGQLTEAQAEGVVKSYQVHLERREQRRRWDEEKAQAEPVPTGSKVTVEGVVVKSEWKETPYGSKAVMTVKSDEGWLVYGSVPTGLWEQLETDVLDDDGQVIGATTRRPKGCRVRFTASVAASDRDPHFGFYKRPRKVELLEGTETPA